MCVFVCVRVCMSEYLAVDSCMNEYLAYLFNRLILQLIDLINM